MAKIAIDARLLGPEGTGLGKYTEKLLENLDKIDQSNEYFVILRNSNFLLFQPKSKNFYKLKADVRWYTLREQFIIPWTLRNLNIDLLHVPHFNAPVVWNKKLVVTIHDLIKNKHKGQEATTLPQPVYKIKDFGYKFVIKTAARKAEAILTPSKTSAQSISQGLNVDKSKIFVTYEAADDFFLQAPKISPSIAKATLDRYGITKPYLFYVGNAYPYKNLEAVLKVLRKLPDDFIFVNAAARNNFTDQLISKAEEAGVRNRFIFTGYVTNEDLITLYRHCFAYVFPSFSEGFGIPGLDAMTLGVPVVASNSSCLPEIYSDAALYFNPNDTDELAEKILSIKNDPQVRNNIVEKGKKQVEKYSWEKMAKETLGVYLKVLSQK